MASRPKAWDEACDFYVIACERDTIEPLPTSEAIVMETCISSSSLDDAKYRAEKLNGVFGKTRIAKLVFIDEGAA